MTEGAPGNAGARTEGALGTAGAGMDGAPGTAGADVTEDPIAGVPTTSLPPPWSGEPYLLAEHAAGRVVRAWPTGEALLAVIDTPGRDRGVVGLGPVEALVGLLHRAGEDPAVRSAGYATLTRGAHEAATATPVHDGVLDPWAAFWAPRASEWDWMWIDRAPDIAPAALGVVERLPLSPGTAAEVAECLARAHPTASTPPDDHRLVGWWGVRDGGRLVAVVGAVTLGSGLTPHLVSLGVDPAARGRGLGALVVAAAVRDGLQVVPAVGPPMISLGLYADNDVARRLYLRLGFRLRHRFASRRPR